MSGGRRETVLFFVVVALLGLTAVWSYGRFAAGRRRAVAARVQTDRCVALGRSIRKLREAPTLRSNRPLRKPELGVVLRQAADAAHVASDRRVVRSISSQSPRPVSGTPYRRVEADLKLVGLTRRELVMLLHHLVAEHPALGVRSMRLIAETKDGAGAGDERWRVDPLVLSYLLLAPSDRRGR